MARVRIRPRYAKDELFKEIVALANTAGGHFFIGISESKDNPPIADAIYPVPDCADLAERLKRSAFGLIEPPIPGLNAVGVQTDPEGGGVIVFRVPQSRAAPHRSSDLHCYVRRGSESVPMSMREIQDLTIHLGRRIDEVRSRFERAHRDFAVWFERLSSCSIGLRITAVPVGARLYIDNLIPLAKQLLNIKQFSAKFMGGPVQLNAFHAGNEAPETILRGIRRKLEDTRGRTLFTASKDGVIEIWCRRDWVDERENVFWLGGSLTT